MVVRRQKVPRRRFLLQNFTPALPVWGGDSARWNILNRIYLESIYYLSGGEPRLVDSICIWKTGARGHRVPWQPPRGGLEPGGDGFFFNFLLFIFLLFFLR